MFFAYRHIMTSPDSKSTSVLTHISTTAQPDLAGETRFASTALPLPGVAKVPAGNAGAPSQAELLEKIKLVAQAASWADANLVNRRDVWGGHEHTTWKDHTGRTRQRGERFTAPRKQRDRGKQTLHVG